MENNSIQSDEMEIDLGRILRLLWSKVIVIILAGVCCGAVALLYSKFLVTPLYDSNTKLYVINRANEGTTTYSDLQSATQLTKDYQVLVTSRYVMEQVLKDLNLNMETDQLISMVTVSITTDSRVLEITVTHKDPYMAKKIVDAIAKTSAQRICDIMKIEQVNIIDEGDLPDSAVSPNTKKNILLGGALGVLLACAVIIIKFVVDDTIKSSDDIERYLGVSTLALIPVTEEMYDGESSKKKHSRARISRSSQSRSAASRSQASQRSQTPQRSYVQKTSNAVTKPNIRK